jgi:hypothetical protein
MVRGDRIDFLLALAGFDPEKIPEDRRMHAMFIADAWRSGIFDIDDVANACGLTYDEVCDVRDSMRDAARPGVLTG